MDASKERPEDRLKRLRIEVPQAPAPLGVYAEAVLSSKLLYLTAMIPAVNGVPKFTGRIGENLDVASAYAAARLSTLNALAAIQARLGSLNHVKQVLKTEVYLVSTEGLARQFPKIADGASDLLHDVFGRAGISVRKVLGVASLPVDVSVMVELLVEVETESSQ